VTPAGASHPEREWRWWRGLGPKLLAPAAVGFAALALVLSSLASDRLERQLTRAFESKGEAIALAMATAAEQNLSGDIALVQGAVDANKVIDAVEYIFVVDDRGRPYVHTFAPVFPAELEGVNPIALGETFEAGRRVKIARDVVFRNGSVESHVIDVAAPVAAGALGAVHVGMDASVIVSQKARLRSEMIGLGIAAAFAGVIACFALMHALVIRPVRGLTRVTGKIVAEGDLTQTISVGSDDEIGELGLAFSGMVERLRTILSTVSRLVRGVAEVSRKLADTGDAVSSGAATVLARVEETSVTMHENFASLRGIGQSAAHLHDSAERASATVQEMAVTNERVAENFDTMAQSVESVAASVDQMASSIQGIARHVERLQSSINETGAATTQMDGATGEIERNAEQTFALSELVAKNASVGVDALEKTLAGIRRINQSSQTARSVIEDLGARVGAIGAVLDVIGDVAEQTNLLALNASIIAAQVGEQGKGFAIVADQVKELAQRTANSTVEIEALINDVREQSRNAVAAMNLGAQSVSEGVRLGDEAAAALRKILETATKATAMVKAIAAATAEQNRGSKHISSSIQRITTAIQEIAAASSDQATRSQEIMQSTSAMRSLTQQARKSSHEQAEASKHAIRSIEEINEMAAHVKRAQQEQKDRAAPVLEALETIRGTSENQNRSMTDLEEAIAALKEQSEVLRVEVERFRL
jgi:methyl-accepting chemotaxis protein